MKSNRFKKQWFKRHVEDPYVKLAQQEGFRSRAVYKLKKLDERDRLFFRGQSVLELGAAPGGWSQFVKQKVGTPGKICAIDLLPIAPIEGVLCIQGDLNNPQTIDQLSDIKSFDIVLSDMAPNLSGMSSIDQPRVYYLMKLALEIAAKHLKDDGSFVVKAFHGKGFEAYIRELRICFNKVVIRKPEASRANSAEVYILARGYRAHAMESN